MASIFQDLRYAFRGLRRTPGFTAAAVLTLALGIGVNTAIFSIVDHVILRPIAYQDPDRLYVVHEFIPKFAHLAPWGVPVAASHFLEWKRSSASFESMALLSDLSFNLTGSGEPEQLSGARVSAELFPMLGVQAQLGRTFLPEEDQPGRDRVVVLNDELWRRRFAADPRVIGSTITLNGSPYEVIGVLPRDFRFPKLADLYPMTTYEERPLLWKPLAFTREEAGDLGNFDFNCIVRLKSGAALSQALGEINAAQDVVKKTFPDAIELRVQMVPLEDQITGRSKAGLQLLLAAVAVVLLIGCVNITNLLLASAASRRKEFAVRSAIGATAGRLMRQMLTESLLLAAAGGAIGIAFAQGALQALLASAPVDLPRMDEVMIDGRVLTFAVVLSTLTAAVVGFLPAWHFANADPQDAMKSISRTTTSGRAAGRLRSTLIGAEVALSAACLVAAGLLLHSFVRLLEVDPGFRSERVLTADLTLSNTRYPDTRARAAFIESVLSRVESLAGITSVGVTNGLPVTGQGGNGPIFVDGVNVPIWERPIADIRGVNAGFFETMSIPVTTGRLFGQQDRERPVVVVSRSLAERIWPNQGPIGKRLRVAFAEAREAPPLEVVGVVGEVRGVSLSGGLQFPTVYVPYWRRAFNQFTVAVKTAGDPASTYAVVRQAIRSLDPELPIPAMRTMDAIVMESVAPRQFQMRLVLLFGIVALLLAGLGIYGVVSYSVAQRTSEMGLRMALGAAPQNIRRTALRQAMVPVAIGLAVGLGVAVGAGRMLRAMLFGVTPMDPVTLGSVALILLTVGFVASYLPARRAMRVNPMVALRTE